MTSSNRYTKYIKPLLQLSSYKITANKKVLVAIALFALLSGCVTSSNTCGNEQRDWEKLSFPKSSYCSVPDLLPFSANYEAANKSICKVHDNNSGIHATMSQREADWRFLCDYIKRSDMPWGVKHVTGYLSYASLRIAALSDTAIEKDAGENIETTGAILVDHQGVPIKDLNNQEIAIPAQSPR